jgi:hypothetical protein
MRQTGTGWCPIKGTIVMDDNWWKKAKDVSVLVWFYCIIVHCLFLLLPTAHDSCFRTFSACGKFRKHGLQNVEELEIYYGSITNIFTWLHIFSLIN